MEQVTSVITYVLFFTYLVFPIIYVLWQFLRKHKNMPDNDKTLKRFNIKYVIALVLALIGAVSLTHSLLVPIYNPVITFVLVLSTISGYLITGLIVERLLYVNIKYKRS